VREDAADDAEGNSTQGAPQDEADKDPEEPYDDWD